MERDLAADPDALNIDSSSLMLVRPEGAWDRRGALDVSAAPPQRRHKITRSAHLLSPNKNAAAHSPRRFSFEGSLSERC
jgi:hypothetical protein